MFYLATPKNIDTLRQSILNKIPKFYFCSLYFVSLWKLPTMFKSKPTIYTQPTNRYYDKNKYSKLTSKINHQNKIHRIRMEIRSRRERRQSLSTDRVAQQKYQANMAPLRYSSILYWWCSAFELKMLGFFILYTSVINFEHWECFVL